MVATTFAIDTPNLVTGLVRENGVAGNWVWWGLLPSGMLTVYVFAKLWRRAEVMTDVEFYELRYSGKAAAFLRGFRALYLGLIFNVLVMGAVSLAAVKFGQIVLGVEAWQMLLVSGVAVLIYRDWFFRATAAINCSLNSAGQPVSFVAASARIIWSSRPAPALPCVHCTF